MINNAPDEITLYIDNVTENAILTHTTPMSDKSFAVRYIRAEQSNPTPDIRTDNTETLKNALVRISGLEAQLENKVEMTFSDFVQSITAYTIKETVSELKNKYPHGLKIVPEKDKL